MNRKSLAALTGAVLFCLAAAVGCKGKEKVTPTIVSGMPPAASASAGAVTDVAGPCGEMITKFCAEVGETAEICSSAKQMGELLSDEACSVAVKDYSKSMDKLKAMRKVCDDLVARFCKDLGEETETCQFVRTETTKFPPDRCKRIEKDYDKHIVQLKEREARNKPLTEEVQTKISKTDAPSFGPETAKVTIVEFSDFQCPYCSRAASVVSQIKDKYKGKDVRFVFRQFPLSFHQQAHLAAEAALAAHEQGKFWEFHDKLFENQRTLQREDLERFAKEVGLDVAAVKKALDSGKYKAQVDADVELGKEAAVGGTPTVFVNGKRVSNPTALDAMSAEIDKALGS